MRTGDGRVTRVCVFTRARLCNRNERTRTIKEKREEKQRCSPRRRKMEGREKRGHLPRGRSLASLAKGHAVDVILQFKGNSCGLADI